MKHGMHYCTLLAAASLVFCGPQIVHAQAGNTTAPAEIQTQDQAQPQQQQQPMQPQQNEMQPRNQTTQDRAQDQAANNQATQMVSASAVLTTALDAKKMQPGAQFEAVLGETVRLSDGTELPRGTHLIGTVASDNSQTGAKAALALRFTQAELKDGKTVPIKAAVIELKPAQPVGDTAASEYILTPWNPATQNVDEEGALPGVDLHTRIDGDNSCILVATKKDDVKLGAGVQMELAITALG